MIFASPDCGAAGAMMMLIGIVATVVCGLVLVGFIAGVRMLNAESKMRRELGGLLIIVALLVPLGCCFGPSQLFRMEYGSHPLGSYPNGRIREGMTTDEVIAILGDPHEVHQRDHGEQWLYWLDSYTLGWFAVEIEDGRVTGQGGN